MKSVLLLAALIVGQVEPAPAAVDPRWVPWLGCWELVEDEQREPILGQSGPVGEEHLHQGGLVCLNPAAGAQGVTVTTASGGEAFLEETLIADGRKNPSTKGNCDGWQRLEWSKDGQRLFTTAELICETHRKLDISGLSMMTGPFVWVDIQIVQSGKNRAVMLRRYQPADEEKVVAAGLLGLDEELAHQARRQRLLITEPLGTDDVIEAAQKVAPEAVEAAVLELEAPFDLDAEALTQLGDAGVRAGLIDLMVALSYPDRLVVERRSEGDGGGSEAPTFYEYGPYAFRYPYYVAPFGYYYWYAPYHPHYVVRPVPHPKLSHGVVSPQGYTRVLTRSEDRRARYRGKSDESGDASYSEKSKGSVSSEGYSRGAPSERKAKPKKKKN